MKAFYEISEKEFNCCSTFWGWDPFDSGQNIKDLASRIYLRCLSCWYWVAKVSVCPPCLESCWISK